MGSKARGLADLGNAYNDGALSNRNLVYNGSYTVAQRGTSYQFSNTNATNYGTVDRWAGRSSSGTTITQSVQSDAPAGFSKSLRYYCDTGGTITAMIRHQQRLEGADWQQLAYGTAEAKTVTLSFWVKSNVTATYTVSLYVWDANDIYTVTYTIDSADTWEYKTLTIAGNTSGNCADDNTAGVEIAWALGATSTYSGAGVNDTWQSYSSNKYATGITADIGATTGNYWQITGVQLEVGDTATPFEHRSYGDELARCQRYYYRVEGGAAAFCRASTSALFNTTTSIRAMFQHPVYMRAVPTLGNSAMSTFDIEPFDQAPSSFVGNNGTVRQSEVSVTSPTARTTGFAAALTIDDANGYLEWDAEL